MVTKSLNDPGAKQAEREFASATTDKGHNAALSVQVFAFFWCLFNQIKLCFTLSNPSSDQFVERLVGLWHLNAIVAQHPIWGRSRRPVMQPSKLARKRLRTWQTSC
jgi:hypothetical protein